MPKDLPNCYFKDNGVLTNDGPDPKDEQGTKMGIEKCALYNLIDALPTQEGADPANDAPFNVGIMMRNHAPHDGAHPRKAFTPMTTANKDAFKTLIKGLTRTGDSANHSEFAKTLYEAYLYFKGLQPYRGMKGARWDPKAFLEDGRYNSPALASCGRNHI